MDQIKRPVDCNPVTTGIIPRCGMLANSYVPVQRSAEGAYEDKKALARGTLFPGLDLPYRGMVNDGSELSGPLEELMAMGFAVHELGLYLDTHPEDKEAKRLFMKYNKLYGEGVAEYERCYGPLQMTASSESFDWVNDPWPWDLTPEMPEPRNMRMEREG